MLVLNGLAASAGICLFAGLSVLLTRFLDKRVEGRKRKDAERALHETEHRLAQAMDMAQLFDWEYDVAGEQFTFSDRYYALHGTTSEREGGNLMSAETFAQRFLHPADAHLLGEGIAKALATADPDYVSQVEARMFRRDGEIRHVLVHIATSQDTAGRTVLFRGANQDITDRKKSERELRELWRAVEQTPTTVVITDASGSIEYANPKFVETTGYSVAEALGKNPRILKSGLHSADFYHSMWETLLQGDVWRGDMQNRKKSGELFWESACIAPVRDEHGKTSHFVAMKEDITERKRTAEALQRAEMQLRESDRRQKAILDNVPDPAWLKDEEGRYLVVNRAWCQLFGLEAEQVMGKTCMDVLPSQMAERMEKEEHCVLSSRKPLRQLELLGGKTANTSWFETFRAPLIDERGNPNGLVGISRDIADLVRARQAAESANRAKSEFLANMSHEIRTPMNGVIGMTGLLLDTELTTEQRRFAEILLASGESLLSLINDILDFSKIEAGKLEMETLDFDLLALLDDFAATLAMSAHDKGIEFICTAAPNLPAYLRGDPGRVRQILTNLTSNAVKFTDRGEIAIRAELVGETDSEVVVRISVKDSGIGIPPDKQGMLFERFTQVDASTTRQYGGSGLGLVISKQLVRLMGGDIGVISELGRGSEFWFTLHLGKQLTGTTKVREEDASELGIIARPTIRKRGRSGAHLRILLAEDNITNQQVALGILRKMGLHADAVANGAEAVKALETLPYDLVLMDVQMPEMDGLEATQRIRAPQSAVANHKIPVIAMTAHAMQGDRERCLEAGMDDYITKPVDPQALAQALNKWLPEEMVPETAAETAVFDRAGMMTRLMDDGELARTVAQGFLQDIPRQIEVLRGFLAEGKASSVERQAHTITGAAANVGGERLREVARAIEKAARAGELDIVKASISDLDAQFFRLKEALTVLL